MFNRNLAKEMLWRVRRRRMDAQMEMPVNLLAQYCTNVVVGRRLWWTMTMTASEDENPFVVVVVRVASVIFFILTFCIYDHSRVSQHSHSQKGILRIFLWS